jgi:hypothetical protein
VVDTSRAKARQRQFSKAERLTEAQNMVKRPLPNLGIITRTVRWIRLPQAALAAALLTVSAHASDKTTFVCSGSRLSMVEKGSPLFNVSDELLIVDLGEREVTGFLGTLSIEMSTETEIHLRGENVMGSLNRYSGAAHIYTFKDKNPADIYTLNCTPAKPLF